MIRYAVSAAAFAVALLFSASAQAQPACELIGGLARFCSAETGWTINRFGRQAAAVASYKWDNDHMAIEVEDAGASLGLTPAGMTDAIRANLVEALELADDGAALTAKYDWPLGGRPATTVVYEVDLGDGSGFDSYSAFWIGETRSVRVRAANTSNLADEAFAERFRRVLDMIEFVE